MTEVLLNYPAFKLIKPVRQFYTDGEVIALPYEADPAKQSPRNALLFRFFTFGSAAGFGIKNGECPEASIVNEIRRGGRAWWLNQNSTVLSDQAKPQVTRPLHQWGDTIRFHGRSFRIDPAPNGNVKLTLIEGNS